MQAKSNNTPQVAVRWPIAEWVWLGEITKSIGTSRSEFVRRAAMEAARAVWGVGASYSVEGAPASQQNTAANQFDRTLAKRGVERSGAAEEGIRAERSDKPEPFREERPGIDERSDDQGPARRPVIAK